MSLLFCFLNETDCLCIRVPVSEKHTQKQKQIIQHHRALQDLDPGYLNFV